jgi:mRNA-degrading endonuclease toxin of MazEF toxin-antitoxin module
MSRGDRVMTATTTSIDGVVGEAVHGRRPWLPLQPSVRTHLRLTA